MSNESTPDPSAAPEVDSRQSTVQFGKVDYSTAQALRIYANHVSSNSTLFDVRLIFNDVDVQGDGVKAIQSLTVLMSLELAQLVHIILGKTLENYTNTYGKSRLTEKLAASTKVETTE